MDPYAVKALETLVIPYCTGFPDRTVIASDAAQLAGRPAFTAPLDPVLSAQEARNGHEGT